MKLFRIACMLVALASGPGFAVEVTRDHDASMRRLQTALGVLNQELAAVYEQIRTLQGAVAANDRSAVQIQSRSPGATMEEIAVARRRATTREEELQRQIDAAFSRIKEIELQKQPLLRRLQEHLEFENSAD